MNSLLYWLANMLAVSLLTFGLYFPRYKRREMVLAYMGINVGVSVMAATLVESSVGFSLGLGLFGLLSIIRLRSTQIKHGEVAYYFAALIMGLLGGLGSHIGVLTFVGMAIILLVFAVADHPKLLQNYKTQTILLSKEFTDPELLKTHLEKLLKAHVDEVTVKHLDMVKNTTLVEVRYSYPRKAIPRHPITPEDADIANVCSN